MKMYHAEERDRISTMFIQDSGYHYLARAKDGEAIGVLYVPHFPEEIIVGVRVIGRNGASFELLTDAQAETYCEMELVPELRYMDRREITITTVSGVDVMSYQLNFTMPGEDYDPKDNESLTVEIPPGALSIGGNVLKLK